MKLKNIDIEKISKNKCQTKGCPNNAAAILKKKFLCKECNIKVNPKRSDKRSYYVRYVKGV